MPKPEIDNNAPSARTTKPARPGRRFMTLDTLNAESPSAQDFDALDSAMFDEPREPEKWY
jgi:hypothetical protein